MKFGTVSDVALSGLDLKLPADPALNAVVLPGHRIESQKIYVGCGNWGHTSWVGKVYPPKTPATKYRALYPLYFGATELNATHYNIYSPAVIREWAEPARGRDFKYSPKFPQQISHYSSFVKTESLTDAFIESISAFEDNLGPAFLQVSDNFSPAKMEALYGYLASLPEDLDVFLEVRHPDWFKQGDQLFPLLHNMNKGLVITDTPGRRDCTHMYLTMPKLLLRFVCNRDHPTTFTRIDDWADRIASWLDRGLEEAYIFLHPGDEALIPELTVAWINALNSRCGLNLKLPYVEQGSLF
ncbi:MAG TPA: DUF72 domain-containing protein [Chitinophagaceae bacterium]|nr:DUF72 domain-containing protein [Chitinophagaceae bacterium]